MTADWQPFVWVVARVPYGDRDDHDRSDLDDAMTADVTSALAKLGVETRVWVLDHIGVADWLAGELRKALITDSRPLPGEAASPSGRAD